MITTPELVAFLKKTSSSNYSFIQNLKNIYRPYICPFNDLLNALPEHQQVLDFGCGGGMFLQLIAEHRKPDALGGVEISEKLIATATSLLAKYQHIKTRLSVYNGNDIPEWFNQYDYIFMIDVLHHVPKNIQIQHLETLFCLMKPGAKLVLKDIDAGSPFVFFNKLHDLIVVQEIGHEMEADKLAPTLQKIGFKISKIERKQLYVYPHYTIVCEKPI